MSTPLTPSVNDLAQALATSIDEIDGLRTLPYLGDTLVPPCALVAIEEVVYHGAFAGGDVEHTFIVYVIVARASDRAGLQLLQDFMSQAGPKSVKTAIEVDPTLGGVAAASYVEKSGPPRQISIGQSGAVYVTVPFTVHVHA